MLFHASAVTIFQHKSGKLILVELFFQSDNHRQRPATAEYAMDLFSQGPKFHFCLSEEEHCQSST